MKLIASKALTPRYEAPSSWWEHVPIAHALTEILQPAVIVELGTHYGVSFFSFCEAAELYSKDTYVYAVDTWEGDIQAGYYADDVYKSVSVYRDKFYSQRSQLLRCTFDEASTLFAEQSIDILHIDGLHTYEAVSHDFNIWISKVKEEGTIIFHDWNVKRGDFGVWKFWDEIKKDTNYRCLEIANGYGLGIATKSKTKPEWHDQLNANLEELKCKGLLLAKLDKLRQESKELNDEISTMKRHVENLDIIIANQELELASHIRNARESKITSVAKKLIKKIISKLA